jgi:hypothetical protein
VVLTALAGSLVACVIRRDRASAFAVALLAFPLIFAAQPGTWYWNDGRYIVFLSPLLAIVLAAGLDGASRWPRRKVLRWASPERVQVLAMTIVVAVAGVLSVGALTLDNGLALADIASGWTHPDGPVDRAIDTLEAHGVHDGYADYWVAYKLDLLSRGTLTVSPEFGDVLRSRALEGDVARARQQAWLFVPPSQIASGYFQFSATPVIDGPRGIEETGFVAALDRMGVGHRTVRAGILDAVVPARPVSVAEVQAAGG